MDDRIGWLKRHLVEFEEHLGPMFPSDWEMSERIAVEFCKITRKDLERAMFKRQREIDTKLLLHGVQKTANFESLLSRRYLLKNTHYHKCDCTKGQSLSFQFGEFSSTSNH